ncbi:CheY chemotaxis protein or a CheY-like REC (receiver) domain [Gillisia sp. Hel1_33_143]|uniref:response regulator n=1 Tax=unclassified Gillisia TaxID=2615025 RepID=UPI0005584883|nr:MULTISPECIES: response regulator [unclassified Gillisia]SDS38735.1 CheY chemotaxis protein or a CheY-like REC (receiver) domain [Gillisia sp. Hel1_33_143]
MNSIYLVDDQPITNFITRKLLEVEGITSKIKEFTNPLIALEELEIDQDPFIFLDLNMPEMTGWEFLDNLKRSNRFPKIVILTSSTSELDVLKAKDYPCVIDYIIKPFSKLKFSKLSTHLCTSL